MSYDIVFEVLNISFDRNGCAILVLKDGCSSLMLKDEILNLKNVEINIRTKEEAPSYYQGI